MRDLKEEGEERDGEGVKIYGGIEGKERGNKGQREKKEKWVFGYKHLYFVKWHHGKKTSLCTAINKKREND